MLHSLNNRSNPRDSRRSHVSTLLRICFGILGGFVLSLAGPTAHAQGIPAGTIHSATLTWTAPSPIGGSGTIAGYNLYRSPPGPPNFTKINTTPVVGLAFIDANVAAGTSYAYCGTTIDSVGAESACSIQVSTTVPPNPNAPGTFSAVAK